jgi:hypothetical protein
VRHIGNGLKIFFVAPVFDGIKAEGENYGDGKTGDDIVDRNPQCIGYDTVKVIGIEELDEIGKPDPGAAPDAAEDIVFLERYLNPEHGNIGKDDDVGDGDDEKEVELPVTAVFFL